MIEAYNGENRSEMMNPKIAIIGVLLLLGVLLVGCRSPLPPSTWLPEVPRIGVEEVKAKLDTGSNIAIIDSRSKAKYDQSHIAGAISIPEVNMAEFYGDLDGYDEIIVYCQ